MRALIFISIILSVFSCKEKKDEKIVVDETSLMEKLSTNDFYKNFIGYAIISRDGFYYLVFTDTLNEVDINYDPNEGVILSKVNEEIIDKKLKLIYPNKYMDKKKKYIFDLNKLLSFMVSNGIESMNGLSPQRVDFYLKNKDKLFRYDNTVLNHKSIESFKRFYDSVIVVDSNWLILKKEKLL